MLELFPDSTRIEGRELVLSGIPAAELADRFGTPLVVYCEETLRARALEIRAAVPEALVLYATKAFPNVAVLRLFAEEGLGALAASLGELQFAQAAGIDGDRLYLHGNAKGVDEVVAARAQGATIVLDSEADLELVTRGDRVLLRVTLGVEADTHEAIRTGHHGSKFGLPPDAVLQALDRSLGLGLHVRGLHAHVGSQLSDVADHLETIELLSAFAARCRDHLDGWTPEIVDVGGGFAVRELPEQPPTSLGELAAAIHATVLQAWDAHGLPSPRVVLEPGRALVGQAGVTIYRVRSVKRLDDVTWVAVDGGMSDNPRPQLYGARYAALSAARADEPATETVSLAGLHCESGDVLIDDVSLPAPREGDLIAIPATGAYTLAMSSNYNATPRPATVLVEDSDVRLIRRRETIDDLLALESTD